MMARLPLLCFVALVFAACGDDELPATRANVQSKVLNVSCNNFTTCHNSGASPAGQLDLSDPIVVAELMRPSIADPNRMILVPGNPEASFLIDKLRNRNVPAPGTSMPPGQPLDEERLSLVERWVAAGAPNE
jgi:hypothetical protein